MMSCFIQLIKKNTCLRLTQKRLQGNKTREATQEVTEGAGEIA